MIISATLFFDKGLMLTALKIELDQLIQQIELETELELVRSKQTKNQKTPVKNRVKLGTGLFFGSLNGLVFKTMLLTSFLLYINNNLTPQKVVKNIIKFIVPYRLIEYLIIVCPCMILIKL